MEIRPTAFTAALALLAAGGAEAHGWDFDLQVQAQICVLAGIAPELEDFSGLEVHAAASVMGIGLSAGLAWERLRLTGGRLYHGGALQAAFQLRPVALGDSDLHEWVDPHIDVGFLLGGGEDESGGAFRLVAYAGAGLDFGTPVAVTVHYRFHAARLPEGAPAHFIMLGLGARAAD